MPFGLLRGRVSNSDPMFLHALEMMKEAMKTRTQAKRRGVDVKPARRVLDQCTRAFAAGDYAGAVRLADDLMRQYAGAEARQGPKS